MKKLLVLLALCMVLVVALVACENDPSTTDDTTAGTTAAPEVTTPEDTTVGDTTVEDTTVEDTTVEDTTVQDTTTDTTTPPPPPVDPVKVGMSFDQLYTGNGPATAGEENFFTPGSSSSWDGNAVIEDYNVQYVTVWGWVAFFAETPATFGYQIGDADPVFDAAFSIEAEQPVVDAAAAAGGKSAARMHISIPVEYLAGEEIVIKALAKDAVGTIETLVEFKLTKPVNPNAPVAFIPAADMAATIPGSPGINGATLSADGTFVTIDTIGQGDPYYQLPMLNGKGTVGAFVAIKYRSTSTHTRSEMFVGSGAGPNGQGDNIQFDLVCDGKWNVMIVDLAQVSAVVDGVINYLRWDPFAGAADATIDMGYIGVFQSAEAALAYDANFKGVFVDTLNVPQDAWTVTGHKEGVTPAEDPTHGAMVAAGGLATGALLHQGYISIGELDLAQFSKLIVYIGIDNSQVTLDHHAANPVNRLILTSADQAMTNSPTDDVVLASVDYAPCGWAVTAFEIDLTSVDYNGPVYFTYDTLPGTFMLVGSIELVYDPNYVEPEEPDEPVEVPEHYDQAVVLGERDPAGAPYMGAGDKKMGQKLPLGENILKQVTIKDLATYADGNTNTWSFKIWAWNTDYATTVAGTPLYEITGENHNDNATFVLDIPVELLITGDVYYELEYLSGSGGFTGWPAKAVLVEGVESYVAGNLKEGTFASSVVIGIPGETPEDPGMIDKNACADFDKFSFDGFYLNDSLYFETDGMANVKLEAINNTVTISGANTIGYRGWISFKSAPAAAFGYYIVDVTDGAVVGEFLQERPDLAGAGIVNGTGYKIDVPVADLAAGTYTTGMVAILADGTVVKLYEITLIVEGTPAEPETPEAPAENYNVPQDAWTISGHCPQIVGNSGHANSPMVAAGGIETGALLHQGSIGVGEINLANYSKVIVYIGIDNSPVTINAHAANAANRLMLTNSDVSMVMSPAAEQVVASVDYAPCGWAVTAFEIDLTGVDYNGPVFLTWDSLPGTFMLIGSIEFVA